MAKFVCNVCGHIHNEEELIIRFTDLPGNWNCPTCDSGKEVFKKSF